MSQSAQVPQAHLADDAFQNTVTSPDKDQLEVTLSLIFLGAYPFSLYSTILPVSSVRYIHLYILRCSI